MLFSINKMFHPWHLHNFHHGKNPWRTWKASWSNICRRIKSWVPRRGGNAQKIIENPMGKLGKSHGNCPRNLSFNGLFFFFSGNSSPETHGFLPSNMGGSCKFSHHPSLWEVCEGFSSELSRNLSRSRDAGNVRWVLICTLCGRVTWNSSGSAEGSCCCWSWSCWALEHFGAGAIQMRPVCFGWKIGRSGKDMDEFSGSKCCLSK